MNFRRCITALAILTLFVGLAAAQTSGTGGGTAMTCTTVAQVTPTVRSEGITELTGDIVITCAGGTSVTPGTLIPQGNIVISLTAPVTSRLQTDSKPTGAQGVPSEALLLIDEPHSGLGGPVAGFGSDARTLIVCTTPGTGCPAYAQVVSGIPVASSTSDTTVAPTATFNVFQGNVSGNTVTFQGIPFLPPVTAGIVRVYRITNIRINATGVGGSLVSGLGQVQAYISTNGSSTLPISNASVTVAFVSPSLVPTVTKVNGFQQCNGVGALTIDGKNAASVGNVALLNYAENFPSAFKTRIAPFGTGGNTSYVGTSTAYFYPQQSIPGQLYNSESGFILTVGNDGNAARSGGSDVQAGLADFGTRFKAVFANLPAGATIYVSRYNLASDGTNIAVPPAVIGGYNGLQTSYAKFTKNGEAGGFGDPDGGTQSTATVTLTTPGTTTPGPGTVTYISVPVVALSGTGPTAVWEVVNTNTSQDEVFTFGVYIVYAPNTTANTPTLSPAPTTPPAAGAPSVTLSYAPTSSTSSIPRFIAGPLSVANGILQIVPCQTLLLFPFVTTVAGFDTGVAISNTSLDPIGTATSSGTCALNFYGLNAPTTVPVIGPIAVGTPDPTKAAFVASSLAPGFQGYLFATCNFTGAHGFAYITSGSLGTPSVTSMGYLALVVNNGYSYLRPGAPAGESLNN